MNKYLFIKKVKLPPYEQMYLLCDKENGFRSGSGSIFESSIPYEPIRIIMWNIDSLSEILTQKWAYPYNNLKY